MKFATVLIGGVSRVAVVENGQPARLLSRRFRHIGDVAAHGGGTLDYEDIGSSALETAKIIAPIPRPHRNVFCVGKNYSDHVKEFAKSGFDATGVTVDLPEYPIIFSKVPESVIGHGDAIVFDPSVSDATDYEAELAVIIGTAGRGIARADALKHVWGYTIVNDVTARDVQSRMKQWLVGKSFDTFCPMGPVAVTADEIDLGDTTVKCWVNGELRQDANTRDLIFDVPTIIETLSAGLTLQPGDVIATGTPAGVGIGFKPPKYLKDGDVVTVEIGRIGRLENPVRAQIGFGKK